MAPNGQADPASSLRCGIDGQSKGMPLLIGTCGFWPDSHSSAQPNMFCHRANPAPRREPATRPPCACTGEMPPRSRSLRRAVRNSQHFPRNDPIASSHPPKASERPNAKEGSIDGTHREAMARPPPSLYFDSPPMELFRSCGVNRFSMRFLEAAREQKTTHHVPRPRA